jgi:hypothetical protein
MITNTATLDQKTRLRRILIAGSLILILIGLAALLYAFWPTPVEQVQQTLPPGLFAPP